MVPFYSLSKYLNLMDLLENSILSLSPVTCRFVHVSSAGVTRPDRPGLDLSKQPPAVRLNKELDFILTFKLKVGYHFYTGCLRICRFYSLEKLDSLFNIMALHLGLQSVGTSAI